MRNRGDNRVERWRFMTSVNTRSETHSRHTDTPTTVHATVTPCSICDAPRPRSRTRPRPTHTRMMLCM